MVVDNVDFHPDFGDELSEKYIGFHGRLENVVRIQCSVIRANDCNNTVGPKSGDDSFPFCSVICDGRLFRQPLTFSTKHLFMNYTSFPLSHRKMYFNMSLSESQVLL